MKLRHRIMAAGALVVTPLIPITTDTVKASNPYDCHTFKDYNGAGRYSGVVYCYKLPQFGMERALLICVISADGTRVTLYGEWVLNAQRSATAFHSGICSVSWQVG